MKITLELSKEEIDLAIMEYLNRKGFGLIDENIKYKFAGGIYADPDGLISCVINVKQIEKG